MIDQNATQQYELNKEYRQRKEQQAARNRQAREAQQNQRNHKSGSAIRIISQVLISLK